MNDAQVMNLSALLAQTAALHPDRPGLIQGDRQWTWREINARVDACVQAMRELGVQPGDKLLVQSRNNLALFESCWAAFRLGAVWVPIYERANYVEPQSVSENQITTGAVKFRTQDPAGEVLGFFEKTLKRSGYFIQPTGTAGGTLQGVTDKGKMSVTITVTSSSENTTGEIHTLRHIDPKDAKGTSPQKPWLP